MNMQRNLLGIDKYEGASDREEDMGIFVLKNHNETYL